MKAAISDAGLRRIGQQLDLPDVEPAATPVDDDSIDKDQGLPGTLYHTTSREGAEAIESSGVLIPKSEDAFVSFSAEPIIGGDIEGNEVVIEVKVPAGVREVQYTEQWFEDNPEEASYIAGEGWQEQFTYSDDTQVEGEDGEWWDDEDLMEEEYLNGMYGAFMAKDTEQEWISAEAGVEVPVAIINIEELRNV